jgi:hypothetical protein
MDTTLRLPSGDRQIRNLPTVQNFGKTRPQDQKSPTRIAPGGLFSQCIAAFSGEIILPATAAPPTTAPTAAMPNLHGVSRHLVLQGKRAGRNWSGLNGQTEKPSESNRSCKYIHLHN